MAAREAEFLAGPEAPGADHQESAHADDSNPDKCNLPGLHRVAAAEMHTSGQQAGAGGNRHAHKILAVWTSRIARQGVVADVKARQPQDSADEIEKTDESACVQQIGRAHV